MGNDSLRIILVFTTYVLLLHICILMDVFFFINMGVRASLRVPRLIPRVLKLTTM
jgi:hypothetical protein